MDVTKKTFQFAILTLIQCFVMSFGQSDTCSQFNTVRVAFCEGFPADAFLSRAKRCGYNYVCAEFLSPDGATPQAVYDRISADIRSIVTKTDKYGLKFIPFVHTSSRWAWHFWSQFAGKNLCANAYTGIAGGRESHYGTPHFSHDESFDSFFTGVLSAIKSGFEQAALYPIEYINLGHDEPWCADRLLMGGVNTDATGSFCWQTKWSRTGVYAASTKDRNWLNEKRKMGKSASEAVQMLLTDEISREISRVNTVFAPVKVKTMIYADMWDKGKGGGTDFILWDGTRDVSTVTRAPGIYNLPGLSDSDKKKVKDNLILVFWNYNRKETSNPCSYRAYNYRDPFKRASDSGFAFMYGGDIEPPTYPWLITFLRGSATKDGRYSAAAFQKNSFEFKSSCLGFYAFSFATYDSLNPDEEFNTMEFMAKDHREK